MFLLIVMGGRQSVTADKVKYIGIILGKKLSWSSHLEFATKKAHVILFACRWAELGDSLSCLLIGFIRQ